MANEVYCRLMENYAHPSKKSYLAACALMRSELLVTNQETDLGVVVHNSIKAPTQCAAAVKTLCKGLLGKRVKIKEPVM